ncbi:ABC transporter permease [Segnochrobactraceae bacterium EtOH-i3]
MHAPASPRPAASASRTLRPLALRFALRELRGGLRGFYVFLACIALGVAAIAGVGSVSRALTEGILAEGRAILGGDISFSRIHRETAPAERDFLTSLGPLSEIATLRAMARRPDGADQTLVEAKAVDGAYPLVGTLDLAPPVALADALAEKDGRFGTVADPVLLDRLGLKVGDAVAFGRISLDIRAAIGTEPDKLGAGLELGPRLLLSRAGLEASGLIQPGSLIRWTTRVVLPDPSEAALTAISDRAAAEFPDAGWQIRSRTDAAPGLKRSIDRFAQFLTLVGLTALVVGGVGVANAVAAFLTRRQTGIATYRSLGASGRFVFSVFLIQILILAGLGTLIGLAVGALIPVAAGAALKAVLPIDTLGHIYPQELALAVLYGLLTALAFALPVLGRVPDIAPATLFRSVRSGLPGRTRPAYLAATALVAAALIALAVFGAHDRRIAITYVVAALATFAVLRGVGHGVMALARRLPRPKGTSLRLALGNLHRPGALTPTVVLSLGLGLTLLVAMTLIDGNLRQALTGRIPEVSPSFFFLDIQSDEADAFQARVKQLAPDGSFERVPMLRGRIVQLKGIRAEDYPAPPEAKWVLSGDRGVTYAATLSKDERLTAGSWWPADYAGPPLVSFAAEEAKELGLTVGDPVEVNVLGRRITATIANLRDVEWQTLAINFVMVFSPNTFAGAPHGFLATLTLPEGSGAAREVEILKAAAADYPTITAVRLKEALDQVNSLVENLALGVRLAAGVTLAAAMLVLGGALAASHDSRIRDAVILKTLGATRGRLVGAYALEYALLGLLTALFALVAGSSAAAWVTTRMMQIDFALLPGPTLGALVVAIAVTVGLGLVGTWRALGEKPARVLRDL